MSYEYEGVTYDKLRDLCDFVGIEYSKLVGYRTDGMPLTQAVDRLREASGFDLRGKPLVAWGKRYESIAELAKEKGVPRTSLVRNLDEGYSPEQAVLKSMAAGILYQGKRYSGVLELAAAHGMTGSLLHGRLHQGMDLHDALTRKVQHKTYKPKITIRGKTYTTYREAFTEHGYADNFISRVKKDFGFTDSEEAFEFVAQFFDRYQGNRPAIIRRIPYVIYNGEWIDKKYDFDKLCGVVNVNSHFRGVTTPLARMGRIKNHKRIEYLKDGVWVTLTQYFNSHRMSAGMRIEAPSREVPVYPDCTFNPVGYCANISTEWQAYVAKRLQLIGKG